MYGWKHTCELKKVSVRKRLSFHDDPPHSRRFA